MNFDKYLFRASQCYDLTTGSIGLTHEQKKEMKELINERDTGININGNKIKWTDAKKKKLDKYIYEHENPSLPKTMESALRKIHRETKWGVEFIVTSKPIQKGILQEEEGFTVYQEYLKKVKGINYPLLNNKKRLNNNFFTGETDCNEHFYNKFKWGFDIKMSWDKTTFPYKEDTLDVKYKWQDIVYMDLTGIEMWKTVYVLHNTHEHFLNNEKNKYYYASGHAFDNAPEKEASYIDACRKLEKLHIVNYDEFVRKYPYHHLVISRDEWYANNWDIPLEERVIEKTVIYNKNDVKFLQERVIFGRKYLNSLN